MKSRMIPVVLLATAALALGGCASGSKHAETDGSGTAKEGALVFGVSNGYPPMEYTDPETKEFVGFDVELGEAIAAKLGKTADWQEMELGLMHV